MPDSLERDLDASVCPSAANATHGAIQPHGCLIGFDSDWRRVCLASANLPRFFGLASTEALGCPPERVVGAGATAALERALALGSPGISLPARPAKWRLAAAPSFLSCHRATHHTRCRAPGGNGT
ncbi:hypothetical protein [Billgrantia antri]|uniref:hypothetical protein n=1 Tax=Billgrantia antri TaxID=2846777 RepID=UPI003B20D517